MCPLSPEAMLLAVRFQANAERGLIERASAIDLMELASDVGPVPDRSGRSWCSDLASP